MQISATVSAKGTNEIKLGLNNTVKSIIAGSTTIYSLLGLTYAEIASSTAYTEYKIEHQYVTTVADGLTKAGSVTIIRS